MRLFSFNNGLDAVVVTGVEPVYHFRNATVADGLEAIVYEAVVDQGVPVFIALISVEGIPRILGCSHIYVRIEIGHSLVRRIARSHIKVAGDHRGEKTYSAIIFLG